MNQLVRSMGLRLPHQSYTHIVKSNFEFVMNKNKTNYLEL